MSLVNLFNKKKEKAGIPPAYSSYSGQPVSAEKKSVGTGKPVSSLSEERRTLPRGEALPVPVKIVLQSLPEDLLLRGAGEIISKMGDSSGSVLLPLREILEQLPSGRIQFDFRALEPQLPPSCLLSAGRSLPSMDRSLDLPIDDIFDLIPQSVLAKERDAQMPADLSFLKLEDPFEDPVPREKTALVSLSESVPETAAVPVSVSVSESSSDTLASIPVSGEKTVEGTAASADLPKPPPGLISISAVPKAPAAVEENAPSHTEKAAVDAAHVSSEKIQAMRQEDVLQTDKESGFFKKHTTANDALFSLASFAAKTLEGDAEKDGAGFLSPSNVSRQNPNLPPRIAFPVIATPPPDAKPLSAKEVSAPVAKTETAVQETLGEDVSQVEENNSGFGVHEQEETTAAFVKEEEPAANAVPHEEVSTEKQKSEEISAQDAPADVSLIVDEGNGAHEAETSSQAGIHEESSTTNYDGASRSDEEQQSTETESSSPNPTSGPELLCPALPIDEIPSSARTTSDENAVPASLPASSDLGGVMRRAGSPPSVLFSDENAKSDAVSVLELEQAAVAVPVLTEVREAVKTDEPGIDTVKGEVMEGAVTSAGIPASLELCRLLAVPDSEDIPLARIPDLLTVIDGVEGAALVDGDGILLACRLPDSLPSSAIGPLVLKAYTQALELAFELGSEFDHQAVLNLGRWTMQVCFEPPFYVATIHGSAFQIPQELGLKFRLVARALARRETGEG